VTYTYMFVYLILTCYFYYFVVVVDCKFGNLTMVVSLVLLCSCLPSSFFVETTIVMPKLPITTIAAKTVLVTKTTFYYRKNSTTARMPSN